MINRTFKFIWDMGGLLMKKLLKMLQIPLEWVDWLKEKPRTPYELAMEIS